MRFTESRRGQDYAKPRLVLSRRRGQARGLHANEQSTRASFHRKESTSPWYTRITTPFGGRTSPGDSMRILRVFVKATGSLDLQSIPRILDGVSGSGKLLVSFRTDKFWMAGKPFVHSPKHLCLPKTSSRSATESTTSASTTLKPRHSLTPVSDREYRAGNTGRITVKFNQGDKMKQLSAPGYWLGLITLSSR